MTTPAKPTYEQLEAQLSRLKEEVERLRLLLDSPATCICDTPAVYGLKSWICQQHGVITTRKPSYEVLNKFYEASQSELSRLKEILKGRDDVLKKYGEHRAGCDFGEVPANGKPCNCGLKQALSKTWEEGG